MTGTNSQQDNPASLLRPVDVALNATGLNRADGSFGANDQLLLFNNSELGYDKAPAIYHVDGAVQAGPWRRFKRRHRSDRGGDIIPAGAGFIVRKAPTADGRTAFWTNSFPVQALKLCRARPTERRAHSTSSCR
jgi:hypothetical protein